MATSFSGKAAPAFSGLGFSGDMIERLCSFLESVRAANARLNLVADAGDDALLQHLLDSLQPLKDPSLPASAKVIDVGTGGGFPGLPLLIARPGWTGVLLDSVRKKTEAVKGLLDAHAPGRGESLWDRAEGLARDARHREKYDLALSRAVGRFSTVAELTLPFLRPGGALLAHRGHEAPGEAASAAEAVALLGGRVSGWAPYDLPGLDKKRYIVRVEKIAPTPASYPRRPGMPAKRPL